MDDIAIKVEHVSKVFKLPHEKQSSVKGTLINKFRGGNRSYERQQVLNDISFEVKRGEFFGIVGRNGSGKSTLLKMLAGIYMPTQGQIQVTGKLTPFIELGVGFNPELTGRENVFLNGALLGFNRKEMDAMYDDIVAFAEIEKFMDQKLKNYSSGMQVRLAFSIAIRAQSDILLFDEVLAVGDAAFQQKCYDMFASMKENGRTIILVTHDMSAVQRFCERAILIDKGDIVLEGEPRTIADKYLEQNFESVPQKEGPVGDENFSVQNVKITDGKVSHKGFDIGQEVTICFKVRSTYKNMPLRVGLQIFKSDGTYVFGTNSQNAGLSPFASKETDVKIRLQQSLVPGTYNITIAVMDERAMKVLRYLPKLATFNVKQQTEVQGVVILKDDWEVGV